MCALNITYVCITITSEGHTCKSRFHHDLTLARNPGVLLLSTRKHSQQNQYTWSTILIKHLGFHHKLRNRGTKGRLCIFHLFVRFANFPLDRYLTGNLPIKSTRKNNALYDSFYFSLNPDF